MAVIEVSPSVSLDLPETVEIRQRPSARRGRSRSSPESDALDLALEEAGLTVEAEIELVPTAAPAGSRRRRSVDPVAETAPKVKVEVAPGESALLLVETEGGVFAWVEPDERGSVRRSAAPSLTFSLTSGEGRSGRRGRRGALSWIGDRLIEPLRVRVLRFAAGEAIDFAVDKIEGDRPFGLVDMSGPASTWLPKPDGRLPAFRGGGPPRVLLMVHGTFSTTAGAFSALELTEPGREFLARARGEYDAVIGFDHSTLAQDPERNARDLMAALEALPQGTIIDSVAHSRGGLVLRTLIERLAPAAREDLRFRRAVFVACTNAGTNLANPENWKILIDLYTNIVMAGARAVALVSGGIAATLVASTVSTLGRFVKLLPQLAIDENRVPGLAAMLPTSELVTGLNSAPNPGGTRYCVIASNFEPRIEPAKGLTGELTEYLIDRIVDRLFQGENDLVVHTGSMWDFGTSRPPIEPESLHVIPAEETIYHIIYFGSKNVAGLLSRWIFEEEGQRSARPSPPAEEPDPPLGDGLPKDFGGEGFVFGPSPDLPWQPVSLERSTAPFRAEPPEAETGDGGSDSLSAGSGAGGGFSGGGGSTRRSRPMRGGFRGGGGGTASPPPAPPPAPEPEALEAAPPEAPEAPVACHFAAEMQPTPPLGRPVPLFVTISPERIAVIGGPASATTDEAVAVDASRPLEIEVITGRNCRVVGDEDESDPPSDLTERRESASLRFIDVPKRGAISLRFELEGYSPGEAEIFIEARQGPRLLASFLLKPVFTREDEDRLTVSQVARLSGSVEDEPAVLRIHEMQLATGSLRLRFELSSEQPNIFIQQDVDLRPNFNLAAFVGAFLAKLDNAFDLEDYDGTLRRIRDFSIVSTNGLIPEKVRRELWRHREQIRAVQVISEDPLIPWELLYIADPDGQDRERGGFLSEWGLVRWMYNARWPARDLRLRDDRVFYVIPDYLNPDDRLNGAGREREMIAARFPGAAPVEASSEAVAEFLRTQAAECDLLHFACHGEAQQEAVLSSDLLMAGLRRNGRIVDDPLGQETAKLESDFGPEAPSGMVFVNACQTGRVGEGIAGVTGFADSFLRPVGGRGANVFIGALWSVDDKLALTYADTLYRHLREGRLLIEASREARKACEQDRDFTWLAYSIYGHPFARVAG
jgi:hypothetical protein